MIPDKAEQIHDFFWNQLNRNIKSTLQIIVPILSFCVAGILVFFGIFHPENNYKRVDFTRKADTIRAEGVTSDPETLRVAVASMISPKETFIYYRELIDYIGAESGRKTLLIQRKTYTEVNELLSEGQIDLAFLCTGPFVAGMKKFGFEVIATPIVRGSPFYQSYLIVHKDSPWRSLAELQGRSFAFTDPESNTGTLVPRYWLQQIGRRPETFFRDLTYTYSHDNSILAVAKKLVDGAAVDSHIWEYFNQKNNFFSSKTRVIHKSESFGSPPLVVSADLNPKLKSSLVEIIRTMHQDPGGAEILSNLMVDRFVEPEKEWYLPVERMVNTLNGDENSEDVAL